MLFGWQNVTKPNPLGNRNTGQMHSHADMPCSGPSPIQAIHHIPDHTIYTILPREVTSKMGVGISEGFR